MKRLRLRNSGLAVLLGWALSGPGAAKTFEFLYIDANEGSASGGHAAIKFDDRVYHFQHVDPGLLRLYRDDFAAFRFAYADQENRTIRGHRIEVSDEFLQTLRSIFNRRLLIQNQQFSTLQSLQEDYEFSQANQDQEKPPILKLKALGYFLERYRANASPQQLQASSQTSPPLGDLLQQIHQAHGPNFLSRKRQTVLEELQALTPVAANAIARPIADNRFDDYAPSFAKQYKNQLLNLAALDVLLAELLPRPGTIIRENQAAAKLNPAQIAALDAFREKLLSDLLRLLNSERQDWGYPLLVGMARLHALAASLESGYLAVLDRRQTDAESNTAEIADADLPKALQYTQQLFSAAQSRLNDTAALDERAYAQIEQSVSALIAIQKLAREGSNTVLPALDNTPLKPGLAEWRQPPLAADALANYRREASDRLENYREQLTELYRYQLLGRNCVTELFQLINDAVKQQTPGGSADRQELNAASEKLLGGYIEANGLAMIPFQAFDDVGERYQPASSFELPSYRDRQIQNRYRTEPDWWVDFRESNTFSSSIYHWRGGDAAFVFFTQDAIWPRPLQGGINLTAASTEAVFGLFSWPWDSGKHLQKSLKGMAVSLPELFFFNIRKGSFPGLLPSAAPPFD